MAEVPGISEEASCSPGLPPWRDPPEACPSHWTSSRCCPCRRATAASRRKPSSPCLSLRLWTWAVRRGDITGAQRAGSMGQEDGQPQKDSPPHSISWRCLHAAGEQGSRGHPHPSPSSPKSLWTFCFLWYFEIFLNHPNTPYLLISIKNVIEYSIYHCS